MFYYKKNTVTNRYHLEHTRSFSARGQFNFEGCASLYCNNDGSALVFGNGVLLSVPAGGNLLQARRTIFPRLDIAKENGTVEVLVGLGNGICTARTSSVTGELVYGIQTLVNVGEDDDFFAAYVIKFTGECVPDGSF